MIDLTKFCGTGSSRYNLDKPWEADGKLVATDGRICVECDPGLYDGEIAKPDAKVPKYLDIFEPYSKIEKWQELPDYGTCEICGDGCEIDCGTCGGRGECFCPRCDDGRACDACDGTGKQACKCRVMFGDKQIARELANKLSDLPEITWGILDDDNCPVFFRFKGGRGAVMPLVEE